jgi:hypothetical protein
MLLVRIGESLRDRRTGVLAALLYAVFSLNDGGRAANVEIFFAPFVLFAFHVFFAAGGEALLERPARPLLLGTSAAVGLQIKYPAAFELVALLVLILLSWARIRPAPSRVLRSIGLMAVGPVVVFGGTFLYFAASGHLADYVYAAFTANLRYAANVDLDVGTLFWMIALRIRRSFPLWLCLFLAPAYVVGRIVPVDEVARRRIASVLLWTACALAGVCSTGRLFAHYFLELLPPLCLLCALVSMTTIEGGGERSSARTFVILILVLSGWCLKTVYEPLARTVAIVKHRYVEHVRDWGDETAAVATYLRPRLREGDSLYVMSYAPILYYLLPVDLPTKYVFSAHLSREEWHDVAPVDPIAELQAIFARRPRYVVKGPDRASRFFERLREELDRSYHLEERIGGVDVYRLRD